jgi:hypothetical protein
MCIYLLPLVAYFGGLHLALVFFGNEPLSLQSEPVVVLPFLLYELPSQLYEPISPLCVVPPFFALSPELPELLGSPSVIFPVLTLSPSHQHYLNHRAQFCYGNA